MKYPNNQPTNNNELLIQNDGLTDGDFTCSNGAKIKIKGDDLKTTNIYAYGIGHVLNDLTATCWFSFLLYYLTDIVMIDKKKAGWIMLSGQIFDGLATPLVGIFSDKYNTKIGKRTPWYIGGTIGVILCFSLIFQKCEVCKLSSNPEIWEMVYYITLPSLFNVAWAAVQVSHMALLPSISINRKNRDTMVRLRTAFTFGSQMLCLFLSFIIFYFIEDKFKQYSYLSLICVVIGTVTSIIFLFLCKEVILTKNIPIYYDQMKQILAKSQPNYNYNTIDNGHKEEIIQPASYGVLFWLKKPTFYKYIIIYMLIRLSINVTSSMLPYYLDYVLGFNKTKQGGTPVEISLIYLFSTSGCLFNSLYLQKFFEKYNSRAHLMFFAWIFTVSGLLPIIFLNKIHSFPIYFLSFTFGIGFALALSTSSSLINDVVGSKGDHGAFVYGAYSLTDKLCTGILLFLFVDHVKDNTLLLKLIVPILPCIAVFIAFLIVSYRRKKPENEKLENDNDKSIIDNSKFSFISA